MTNLISSGFTTLIPGTEEFPFLSWSNSLKIIAIAYVPAVTYIALDRLPYDFRFRMRILKGQRPWNEKREKPIYGRRGHINASIDSAIGIIIRHEMNVIEIPLPNGVRPIYWTVLLDE